MITDEESKDRNSPLEAFQFTPTCGTSGRGQLIYGDSQGQIRLFNRDFEPTIFQAYETCVTALHQLKRNHVLLSIGNDAVDSSTLKIWRLDSLTSDGTPTCVRTIKLYSSKVVKSPVTCFDVLEDMTQVVVGFAGGAVLLLDGNIMRDRHHKQQFLVTDGPPVTGLHFVFDENQTSTGKVALYVVTESSVCTYFTKLKNYPHIVLDSEGGAPEHCSVANETRQLICGREQAVYFYETEEKGICFGFDGDKQEVGWFNSYLYIVEEEMSGKHQLTIYDLKNKFRAFQFRFDRIMSIVVEWGSLFVFTSSGKMYQLSEKDLPTKMNTLFKRNLYSIALSLAHSQDCDEGFIKEIFQMYGDHLYSKADYDGAISQYMETIGYVEPSYVIRKFLDAQRIQNLTRYLQALHERRKANTNHTTLLLNCYTKLKDVDKLNLFIQDSGLKFDVKTAIEVCRQANYYSNALFLAKKHKKHSLYLKIQLEDEQNFQEALHYIWALPFQKAERFVTEYGAKLMIHCPDETTELLEALCTNWIPMGSQQRRTSVSSDKGEGDEDEEDSRLDDLAKRLARKGGLNDTNKTPNRAKPDGFLHFFVGCPAHLVRFLEVVKDKDPAQASPVIWNTLLELYMQGHDSADVGKKDGEDAKKKEEEGGEEEKKESDSNENNTTSNRRRAGSVTLTPVKGPPLSLSIMKLLKDPKSSYDVDLALLLCKTYGFEDGVIHLYEKLFLYSEILQYLMDRGLHTKIMSACNEYGIHDDQLWIQALNYFAAHPEPCERELKHILQVIEQKHLLPPLMVVQIMAKNPTKQLAVIRDYIVKCLEQETVIIDNDERQIRHYQEETKAMREEIEELTTSATTFQGTKCHACTNTLELPAVHFLCMHSFHQRCMGDNDRECMKCASDFRKVADMKHSLRASATHHDQFFKQLEDSRDGFATVAEYFGRGIFQTNKDKKDAAGSKKTVDL